MHIAILATSPEVAKRIKATIPDGMVNRYTIVTTWSEVVSSLRDVHSDLIIVERNSLDQMKISILFNLTKRGRWPPLLLVDSSSEGIRDGITLAQHLGYKEPHYYQVGDLRVDTRKRRAGIDERWVTLPPIQYRLLLTLAQRAGEVIDCRELLRLVWGYEAEESEARELVKVHIRQIRRRLGLNPEMHHYIQSVRGFGYMLASPDED